MNLTTGEIKQLTRKSGTSSGPLYSPDGKTIAFMSADSTDQSAWAETKLWMMNADGSNAHARVGESRSSDLRRDVGDDNSGVYFNVDSEGSRNLYFIDDDRAQPRAITSGQALPDRSRTSTRTASAVGVRATPTKPNDIVTFTPSDDRHR